MYPSTDVSLSHRILVASVWGISGAAFLMGVWLWNGFLLDDAFITFRYARNVAEGYGIVWNPGGEPTEGFSSPLMVALMVPVEWLGGDSRRMAQVLGVLANGVAVPWLLWVFSRTRRWAEGSGPRFLAALVPPAWLLLMPTIIHSITAMETAIATALVTAFVVTLIGAVDDPAAAAGWPGTARVALLAVGVVVVRPEGIAIVVVTLLAAGRMVPASGSLVRKVAVVVALTVLCGAAMRLAYFGYVLPNPFYHKVDAGTLAGLDTVQGWLWALGAALAVPLLAWVIRPPVGANRLDAAEVSTLAVVTFAVVFFSQVRPIAAYAYRMLWPFTPAVLVAAIAGLARLDRGVAKGQDPGHSCGARVVVVAVRATAAAVLLAVLISSLPPEMIRRMVANPFRLEPFEFSDGNYRAHWVIGSTLGELELGYGTTISALEAGIIPYLAKTRAIDLFGLNDNTLTRGNLEERQEYLAANPLDVFYDVSRTGSPDDLVDTGETASSIAAEARRRFEDRVGAAHYAGSFRWGAERHEYLVVWVRRAHPRADEIVARLRERADFVHPPLRWGPYPDRILTSLEPSPDE